MRFLPRLRTLVSGLTAFVIVYGSRAYAQGCCTVGASSLGGVESGVLRHRSLALGVNYQFNSLTRAYQERRRIDDPLRRTASVGYFSLHLEYGLAPDVALFAALPFADKSREVTVTNAVTGLSETARFGSSGIGDMTVLMKYRLVAPSILSPFELAIGGGATLPTGSFTKMQNNSQLAIDLQPGTGAASLFGWVYAMRSFPSQALRFLLSATYRYAGTNFDGYRLGDEIIVVLGGEYVISENFVGALLLRSRFAAQDFAARRILSATGGTYHDLMPAVSYVDGPSRLRVFAQLPVYRNVRGIQLTVAYLLGIELSYTVDLNEGTPSEAEEF